MKLKNCKAGLEVFYTNDTSSVFTTGERLVIEEVVGKTIHFEDGRTSFSKYIEPINKFEIGEEVLLKTANKRVYYCGYTKDGNQLVETKKHGTILKIAPYKLSALKQKNKLEVGDKITRELVPEEKLEILLVEEDSSGKVYVCRALEINYLVFVRPKNVKTILYD